METEESVREDGGMGMMRKPLASWRIHLIRAQIAHFVRAVVLV